MCGRFAFYSPKEAVAALFGTPLPPPPDGPDAPHYNLAPTQLVPVIRWSGTAVAGADAKAGSPADAGSNRRADGAENAGAEGAWLHWGLIPSWAKDPAIGNRLINARVETVADKPAFRRAFRHRRCVLLASGFYEWQAAAGGKQPYFMAGANTPILAFAGLWESWRQADGQRLDTCTIVTTAAAGIAATVHDRMPLLVPPALLPAWLTAPAGEALAAVLAAPPTALTAVPVSRAVNSPKNDGPELVQGVRVSTS